MRTLFLDLASHSSAPDAGASVACVAEDTTAAIRFVDHRIGDEGLMPLLDDVLREAGWAHKDLTHIACVTGPGGFTSLRMAVTLANVLADQLHIPLAGAHLSDLYAARVIRRHGEPVESMTSSIRQAQDDVSFIWIHATKKKELFVRGFGAHAALWPEATLVTLEDLSATYPAGVPFAGELLPEQRAVINVTDAALTPLAEALPLVLKDLAYTDTPLAPWYGRGW